MLDRFKCRILNCNLAMENRLYKWLKALFIYEFYEELYPLMCNEGKDLGPVVQKPINANPRLKNNQGVYFSTPKCCSKLIFGKALH